MSEFNNIAIYRLNTILSLFGMEDAEYSIRELAELLNVPVATIREDIIKLHENEDFDTCFIVVDDEKEYDLDNTKDILSGKMDDVRLMAENTFQTDFTIPLTPVELECLNAFLEDNQYFRGTIYQNYDIKPLPNFNQTKMLERVAEFNKIIRKKETLDIVYRKTDGKRVLHRIKPLKVVEDSTEQRFYIVTVRDGKLMSFRLDRIIDYSISPEKIEIDDMSPLELLPNVWGMEINNPVHVKIKILNEAKVQEKVRKDLECRTNGKFTMDGDILYFEDDVIGINGFKRWLYGYGSSILVVAPKDLRDAVIQSARKRLEFYNKRNK